MQDSCQKSTDLLLLELTVVIRVELNQLLVHHLSHSKSQVVVGKLETLETTPRHETLRTHSPARLHRNRHNHHYIYNQNPQKTAL